jgi:hypothetical protein
MWKFLCFIVSFFRTLFEKLFRSAFTPEEQEATMTENHHPHHLHKVPHVLVFYRNPKLSNNPTKTSSSAYSHTGLSVSSENTSRVLNRAGIKSEVHGIWSGYDVARILKETPTATHAILEAPWIGAGDLKSVLLDNFPQVQFAVRCHSQIGFLQVEPGAIKLIRDYLVLRGEVSNFTFASNSNRLTNWIKATYGNDDACLYLPNLYDYEGVVIDPSKVLPPDNSVIRVSSFGALRDLKNHTTAAAGAMLLAKSRGLNLEFYVNTHREEHGSGVLKSLHHMFDGLSWAKLVEVPWQDWNTFCNTIASMDVCFQVSATETFNIVTADACAAGVPSVVGSAIAWLPEDWHARIDDPQNIADVANYVLEDRQTSVVRAADALEDYVSESTYLWVKYLCE